MPDETALVPVSALVAQSSGHEHLHAIIAASADPHARRAAETAIKRLTESPES